MKSARNWLTALSTAVIAVIVLSLYVIPLVRPPAVSYSAYDALSGWRAPVQRQLGMGWQPAMGSSVSPTASGMLASGLLEMVAIVLGVAMVVWLVRALDRKSPKNG